MELRFAMDECDGPDVVQSLLSIAGAKVGRIEEGAWQQRAP